METNEEMPNFTLQFDFSSSSTSEDVNERAMNEENISQMQENRATNNIYHIIEMSFSIISTLIIVLLSHKRNIKHFSTLYSL